MRIALLSALVLVLQSHVGWAYAHKELKKSFDGYSAACPSDIPGERSKFMAMSLNGEALKVIALVCREGTLRKDETPARRSYTTEEGVRVTEEYSKFKIVFVLYGQSPQERDLSRFSRDGYAMIPLREIPVDEESATEVFVTAEKIVSTNTGLRFNAGRESWGSYLLH